MPNPKSTSFTIVLSLWSPLKSSVKRKSKAGLWREDTAAPELGRPGWEPPPPPSSLDSAKESKQPPSTSCGNLIGSLFLAVRSQTKDLPPRLGFKVFSSGRLSLTSSRSHRPNWFLPPPGLPQRPLMHLLPSLSHCIFIICLQLCSSSQPGHMFSGSRHTA